ncbi:MAG TPA: hypothetical protein VKV39_17235 [Candidatus Sulfotelmatobacter sp.]|nr:hypothetical protein [Candidatus Sulfotelmatobacter sp.]
MSGAWVIAVANVIKKNTQTGRRDLTLRDSGTFSLTATTIANSSWWMIASAATEAISMAVSVNWWRLSI